MTTTRRLAAILAADVAGYSAAMERDEEGTAAAVRALRRDVIEPKLAEHHGRLIKTTGDGFLAEFASPIAALKCALAIQQRPDEGGGLRLRIGLNLGDVIIEEGGDLLGEGVNIAARLESLAEPGGILISDKILREVEGKVDAGFEDRGEQQVKNITRPVRSYAVRTGAVASAQASPLQDFGKPLLLPDKPSIAVLPFQNMSGDPEQEYFADGMVEDIITALSRFKSLFVIARNSSFTYKGKVIDIKQVGRELGVRYVLEGSVRKAGGRVRITGQLIEAASSAHLWADRFDGALEDIFDLQDKVTASVVGAIASKISRAEIERIMRSPPRSWDAYDHYLRGRALRLERRREGVTASIAEYRQAIAIDPTFAPALTALASAIQSLDGGLYQPISEADRAEAIRLTERALQLAADDAHVVAAAVWTFALLDNDLDRALSLAEKAIELNPNLSEAWTNRGWSHIWLGEPAKALDDLAVAMRLNPADPVATPGICFGNAMACFFLKRTDEHVAWLERTLNSLPSHPSALIMLARHHEASGRTDDARKIIERLLIHNPNVSLAAVRQVTRRRHRKPEFQAMLEKDNERLVALGLPE